MAFESGGAPKRRAPVPEQPPLARRLALVRNYIDDARIKERLANAYSEADEMYQASRTLSVFKKNPFDSERKRLKKLILYVNDLYEGKVPKSALVGYEHFKDKPDTGGALGSVRMLDNTPAHARYEKHSMPADATIEMLKHIDEAIAFQDPSPSKGVTTVHGGDFGRGASSAVMVGGQTLYPSERPSGEADEAQPSDEKTMPEPAPQAKVPTPEVRREASEDEEEEMNEEDLFDEMIDELADHSLKHGDLPKEKREKKKFFKIMDKRARLDPAPAIAKYVEKTEEYMSGKASEEDLTLAMMDHFRAKYYHEADTDVGREKIFQSTRIMIDVARKERDALRQEALKREEPQQAAAPVPEEEAPVRSAKERGPAKKKRPSLMKALILAAIIDGGIYAGTYGPRLWESYQLSRNDEEPARRPPGAGNDTLQNPNTENTLPGADFVPAPVVPFHELQKEMEGAQEVRLDEEAPRVVLTEAELSQMTEREMRDSDLSYEQLVERNRIIEERRLRSRRGGAGAGS